jgi:hypothetical protein
VQAVLDAEIVDYSFRYGAAVELTQMTVEK